MRGGLLQSSVCTRPALQSVPLCQTSSRSHRWLRYCPVACSTIPYTHSSFLGVRRSCPCPQTLPNEATSPHTHTPPPKGDRLCTFQQLKRIKQQLSRGRPGMLVTPIFCVAGQGEWGHWEPDDWHLHPGTVSSHSLPPLFLPTLLALAF